MTRGIDRSGRSVLLLALLASLLALPAPAAADVAFEDVARVVAGSPRAAAIAISRELYTANAAGAVVLARQDDLAVGAQDASGNRSALSAVVTAAPTDEVPASPGDQAPTVAPASGGIEVSWVAAPEADVVGYEVQRLAVSPFGGDCDPGLFTGWEDVSSAPIVGTTLLDDDVMSGRAYCYRYRPIDSTGNAPSHSLPNGPVEAP